MSIVSTVMQNPGTYEEGRIEQVPEAYNHLDFKSAVNILSKPIITTQLDQ